MPSLHSVPTPADDARRIQDEIDQAWRDHNQAA